MAVGIYYRSHIFFPILENLVGVFFFNQLINKFGSYQVKKHETGSNHRKTLQRLFKADIFNLILTKAEICLNDNQDQICQIKKQGTRTYLSEKTCITLLATFSVLYS